MFSRQLIYLMVVSAGIAAFATMTSSELELVQILPGYSIQFLIHIGLALASAGLILLLTSYLFGRSAIQKKAVSKNQILREIRYGLMWLVTACLLGSVVSIIIGKGWSKVYLSLHAYPEWYLPASIILTLFVLDTYAYFSHRFILHGPLYESVHRIHHLSTRPDMISQFQLSPIEQLITSAFLVAVICIIPLHPIALLVVSAFTLLRGILSHSGIEIFPKGHLNCPWASWLNPNIHHDLHHRHFNCHYALHFRWWDRLLRTEHPEYEADYAEAIKRVEGKKLAKGIK